jgi:hypothetical protein
LADVGIDKKLSSRAQKLAAVPEDKFEGMLGGWRDRVADETEGMPWEGCANAKFNAPYSEASYVICLVLT